MPGPYPREFREDVVAVARRRESGVTIKQIATDFGISEATLQNWLRQADVEEGNRPGQTAADAAEARELKKRISLSVLPSLYDDIQKIAYVQRRSVSELLSAMMEEYRGSHAAELAEYEEIQR